MHSRSSASTAYPILSSLAERQSPRAFRAEPVTPAQLGSLLEAARWAPSCFNEQPWRFVFAHRSDGEAFERMASCLAAANARWAAQAPVLMLSVAKTHFARNDEPNRHAWHDVGLAVENLVVQAQSLGLGVHQMAGFDAARAREVLAIPEGFEPVAMLAIGQPGDPEVLPDDLRARELAPRQRQPLANLAFEGRFGAIAPLAKSAPA
ncbi:MAG: nitroreductase family protein [Planctomycetota bacterium]